MAGTSLDKPGHDSGEVVQDDRSALWLAAAPSPGHTAFYFGKHLHFVSAALRMGDGCLPSIVPRPMPIRGGSLSQRAVAPVSRPRPRQHCSMNFRRAISSKLVSVLLF